MCRADGFQPKGRYNINTKSAIFSCQQVRIMAFLYAIPVTQNNSLLTIAFPGIPQNRKCCFIYNKLPGMFKQSMPTQWVRALCSAPNEPAFPERQFLIKVNTVLCLIKVNKYFPKSHIVSRCFAIFSSFSTNTSIMLLENTEHRGQDYGGRSGHSTNVVGRMACLHLLCFSITRS